MKTSPAPRAARVTLRRLACAVALTAPVALSTACSIKTWNATDAKKAPATTSNAAPVVSQFAGRAKLCGNYLSFDHYTAATAADAASGRAFAAKLSLGVCGSGEAGAASWQALAVSLASSDVSARPSDAGLGTPATLSVTDAGQVFLTQGSAAPVAIGKMEEVDAAMPIELVDGAAVQLQVDGQPYQLEKHSKDSPGQKMVFTLP